jgi:exodeoxyribonuclease VII large subunit
MAKEKPKIYSVSQINSLVRVAIEETLPSRLIVRGEISDWKHHTSGHCYFSLKDENAVLPCVMWASSFRRVKFKPENGVAVLATGHIDVYTVGGKYQLYVDKLEPEGVGALQLAFEQMYNRLKAEGLFEEKYKKPLPKYPMRIGVLTSESGAAVHDITDSVHNRWPCAGLFFYPVPVQGKGAAEKIAAALRDVNRRNKTLALDILIVGRGGGSLEDLWAFNEEVLARAIFDSAIPVISAVGHEIDVTIADLVADCRASTPTKAGVVAVPDIKEVLGQLAHFEENLAAKAKWKLRLCAESLKTILAGAVFKNPLLPVRIREQRLDEFDIRFGAVIRVIVNKCQMELTAQANRLAGLNPKSVLQRGYSITTKKKTGMLIRRPEDIELGDAMITELAEENLIESKVIKK